MDTSVIANYLGRKALVGLIILAHLVYVGIGRKVCVVKEL